MNFLTRIIMAEIKGSFKYQANLKPVNTRVSYEWQRNYHSIWFH